jgi:alpha-galactosidase
MKFLLPLLSFIGLTHTAMAQMPDLTSPDLWKAANAPFSFTYAGKDSSQLLPGWQPSDENATVTGLAGNADHAVHRYIYTDPDTKLTVTAEVRTFPDFPGTVDWVLYFKNGGAVDTPIIENIQALKWAMPAVPGDCTVRHALGSSANADDFKPLEEHLGPGGDDNLGSANGRSSDGPTLPFFNVQTGDHGVIGAIGWTGNWKAGIHNAHDGKSIALNAGMRETHLVLHPGEEIRSPRIVLQAWTGGDWGKSQNIWRRLILAHYTPHDNGQPLVGPVLVAQGWGGEEIKYKLPYIQWLHDNKIPVDVFGIDAGWYGTADETKDAGPNTNEWWQNRGDWFPSPFLYPQGVKELGAACKAAGLGFICWFEPETCMPGKKIAIDHPDWFLHSNHPVNPGVMLANYSNPAALRGITDMVSGFITDFGVTWYRQDFNIPPEEYWALNDKPDRVGMTEIGYITGMYKMWDELLAKHPGLHIDNCASGGRRIDLETMSRSFIIWRTDHGTDDHIAEQAMTTGLSPWVPGTTGFEQTYTGSKPWTAPGPYNTAEHVYLMRVGYQAGFGIVPGAAGVDNPAWVAWIKQAIGEYKEVQPYFYGDFYSLVPYSLDDGVWTAWQWDRPEKKDGVVIVLRRPGSPFSAAELDLHNVDPAASYEVEIRDTYDKAPVKKMKGSDLAKLPIQLPQVSSSTLVFYRQK